MIHLMVVSLSIIRFSCITSHADTTILIAQHVSDIILVTVTLISETPITFVKELTDVEIDEESTLTLTCETSKPKVDVKWFRDDKEIKVTDKRAKFSKKDAVHTLTIEKVTKDDQAKYSCQIVKNKVKTEGKVTTKGINNF